MLLGNIPFTKLSMMLHDVFNDVGDGVPSVGSDDEGEHQLCMMREGDWYTQYQYDPVWNQPIPGIQELDEAISRMTGVKPDSADNESNPPSNPEEVLWGRTVSRSEASHGSSYYPQFSTLRARARDLNSAAKQ